MTYQLARIITKGKKHDTINNLVNALTAFFCNTIYVLKSTIYLLRPYHCNGIYQSSQTYLQDIEIATPPKDFINIFNMKISRYIFHNYFII